MGIDCSVCVVNWADFVSALDAIEQKKLSDGDAVSAWFDFCDTSSVLESKSPIHGSYSSYGYFLDIFDANKSIRDGLSLDQREKWDRFFGLLMPSYFYGVREYSTADVRLPLDVEHEHIPEIISAALSPKSVQNLYSEIWCRLDLAEFEKCADEAFEIGPERNRSRKERPQDSQSWLEDPYPDLNFRDVAELILYIRAWGEVVEFAANRKMGLVVSVCA